MHLKEQWIREGFSSYYVVKKEQKLTYEKNILYNHTLPCLLPCEFRIEDGEEYYYYDPALTNRRLPVQKLPKDTQKTISVLA